MDVSDVLQNISERRKQVAEATEVSRNVVLDVGILTAWDAENITLPKEGPEREEYLLNMARDDVQIILNKLYSMEMEVVEGERVLKLPEPTTVIPRARPLPQPKPPTKWERFAREKGIKSKSDKRRDKLVYDETSDKWVPRYGYKRAKNEEQKDWLIEIPDGADPSVDYFAKKREEKNERVAKNKFQQLRNKMRNGN